jgi:hypothetical protein
MLQDRPPRLRWPRGQKFQLSAAGVSAEAEYRQTIETLRGAGSRTEFDAARESWAGRHLIQPEDGVYLGELRAGGVNLQQIVEALDACGKSRKDAISAVERLVDKGLVAPEASSGSR